MEALIFLLKLGFVIGYVWLTHWVATRAERKGRSYNLFLALALFTTPLVPLALLEVLPPNMPQKGDAVRTLQRTKLDDGTMIPRSYRSEILDTKLVNQTQVVQINGPANAIWVARDNVSRV